MSGEFTYQSRDGLTLFAKSYGPQNADVTVLCLHGLTRNHKDFEPMIGGLAEHRRYIALDFRGRGQSDWDSETSRYRLDIYVQDVQDLLKQIQPKKLILIGTSMGGLVSLFCSHLLSNQLLGLVINDIGPKIENHGLKKIVDYLEATHEYETWNGAVLEIRRAQEVNFPTMGDDAWLDFARRTHKENDKKKVVADYDPAIANLTSSVVSSFSLEMQLWTLFSSTYQRPLLVIRGELSDVLSSDTAAKMVHRHGRANIVSVSNVGHAPMLDEPICIKAIESFLRKFDA